MQNGQEFVAAVNNSSLALALAASEAALAAGERIARLQTESARSLFQESVEKSRKLLAVKGLEEVTGTVSTWSQDGVEKLSGYARNYVSILQEAQAHVSKALEENTAAVRRELLETAEKAVLQSPVPGGESLLAGMKVGLNSATTAMDALNQMFQQWTEFAGASLKAGAPGAVVSMVPTRKRAS